MMWIITDQKADVILSQIDKGPDRIAAIVAVAHLEDVLTETLSTVFEGDNDVKSRMLKGYGPLASLAAKIDLAHMMGMLPRDLRKHLFLVKDIRNEFAHTAAKTTFKSQRICDLTKNLPAPLPTLGFRHFTPTEARLLYGHIIETNPKMPESFTSMHAIRAHGFSTHGQRQSAGEIQSRN
jgi:DNA-binding MltR family transcriptional regulator